MRYTTPLIILAGGKSSRMGRDKALLPFGGYSSLAQFQYNRLQPIFETIYISAKENKFSFDFNLIEDRYPDSSPLVALISILEELDVDEVFLLSVDAPFIDRDTIKRLFEANTPNTQAIISKSPNGIEPLCGVYKKSILPIAKNQLAQNNHRLNDLLRAIDTTFVEFSDSSSFLNMNYIEDYEEGRKNHNLSKR